jgi:hypothetical protein
MQKPSRRNNVLHSPRLSELKKKKKKIFTRKIIIFTVLFLLLVAGLSYVSRIKRLSIADIAVTGNVVIDTETIKAEVDKELAGKYFWLFPRRNILLYPKNKIKRNLAKQYKRLTDISVSVGSGQTMMISVSERNPEYTWCRTAPVGGNGKETCYFLDKEGYIFDQAPYFSGEVYFKFYGLTDGIPDTPAGSYVAKGYFDKLILFKDTLAGMNLKPAVVYIPEGEDIHMYLSKTKSSLLGPEIIFKKDSDFAKIAENLKAAISTEPLKSKFKKEYSNLEYLDLRFSNKVYYKFK